MNTLSLRSMLRALLVLMAIIPILSPAAADDKINTTRFGNVAIKGFDTVAYFVDGEAIKGSKDFTWMWRGANWRFSSQENLDRFKASPESFAPEFGGYCAYAVAHNKTASIQPDLFSIYNGKLYLSYNKKINRKFLADQDKIIDRANSNWPEMNEK